MRIDGCVHVDPDSDERICPACREMLRREQLEPRLEIVPIPTQRERTPPPIRPDEIDDILDRGQAPQRGWLN